MGQNIVDIGFDIEKLTTEKKQVLDLFVDLFGKLQEYDGTKFNPLGNGGLVELRKSINDGANAMAAFGEVAAKYNQVITDQYQKQVAVKKSTDDLTAARKESQKALQGEGASGAGGPKAAEAGSINAAKEAIIQLTAERNKLNLTTDEGIAKQQALNEKIEQAKSFVSSNSSGPKANGATGNEAKKTDELTLATKAYENVANQLAQTQAKNNAATSDAAEGLAVEREALRTRNAELAASAKYQLAEVGSVAEARAQITQLKLERDKLNASEEEGQARIQELNAAIDKNNQFINANTSKIEQQKNNVGNYAGAIAVLQTSLGEIAERLEGMSAAGNQASEAYQRLTLEQKILQQQLSRQQEGFSTVNGELRSLKTALDAMTLAGMENTEAFEKLNLTYTTAKQKVNELHEEQKILTAESPAFTALAAAARGLGGAYALGAGASALFASGNEKVEKELNKLVAVMTLLQGLEEAVKAVKDRGAIATALQATATKALNAIRQIEVAIFGQETAAVEANTIAMEANAAAQEAGAAGLEASAVAAEATTGAMEGVTIAEGAATAGAITFRTALITTGIGAIIVALIYGVTKLVGAISDWVNADEKAIEKAKALAEANKELFDLNQKLNEVYEEGAIKRLNSLEKVDEAIKAAGKNQFIQLDNERRIAEQTKQIAQDQLTRLGVTNAKREELQTKQQSNYGALIDLQKDVREATAKGDKDEIEKAQKRYDANKAVFDLFETKYSTVFKLIKDLDDADHKLNVNTITTAKAAADELEKIAADSANRRYAIEKDAADRTLNDPKSSFSEREIALKASYQAEAQLAEQHIAVVRKQIDEQKITEADGANQIANIQNDLNLKYKKAIDDRVKLRTEERDRNITAQNGVSKNNNESDAAIQEAITKDTQRELDARLTALKANIDDKTRIINDEYNTQLKLAKDSFKTQDEIAQLTSDRDKQLVALTADTQKQIYDIVTSYGERKLKAIEEQNKAANSANAVTDQYNKDSEALDAGLTKNIFSYNKYLRDKEKLDDKYAIAKTAADIKDDEEALQRLKDFQDKELKIKLDAANIDLAAAKAGGNEDEIAKAQAKVNALTSVQTKGLVDIANLTKKLGDDDVKNRDAKNKKVKEGEQLLANEIGQLEQKSWGLATTLVDSSYENRINKIQETMDRQDEQYGNEIAAIQRSTLSQRDQAAEVTILQAQQKAQDTALKNEQKKEKIAEAKFDRDVAVAKVIWETEAAIATTFGYYGGTPLAFGIAAAMAALGAVEVATILAKPIPTYAEGIGIPGKGIHPGGYAVAGEAGPELVSIPGREPFVLRQPTLIDLPVNSSVQPLNASDLTYGVGAAAMQWQAAIMREPIGGDNNDAWAIARWQSAQMRKAIKSNQQKIVNKIEVHVDTEWASYLATKVTGRR